MFFGLFRGVIQNLSLLLSPPLFIFNLRLIYLANFEIIISFPALRPIAVALPPPLPFLDSLLLDGIVVPLALPLFHCLAVQTVSPSPSRECPAWSLVSFLLFWPSRGIAQICLSSLSWKFEL
jgi:hypothetical protein